MKRTEMYIADRAAGMTYREIAAKYGVSHQAVAQVCGKRDVNRFKPYSEEDVVYPNLRRWLNDNKITRREFSIRMGNVGYGTSAVALSDWFKGKNYPTKKVIDKMLAVTGLTYEEMWADRIVKANKKVHIEDLSDGALE